MPFLNCQKAGYVQHLIYRARRPSASKNCYKIDQNDAIFVKSHSGLECASENFENLPFSDHASKFNHPMETCYKLEDKLVSPVVRFKQMEVDRRNCPSGFRTKNGICNKVFDPCDSITCNEVSSKCRINGDNRPECFCRDGFELINSSCEDINECAYIETNPCDLELEVCENTIGSSKCICKEGFVRDNNEKRNTFNNVCDLSPCI